MATDAGDPQTNKHTSVTLTARRRLQLQEEDAMNIQDNLRLRFCQAPPIVRRAIVAMLDFEEHLDDMGYDLSYYQQDLPDVVKRAIEPWKDVD